jgi:hypothetical protein
MVTVYTGEVENPDTLRVEIEELTLKMNLALYEGDQAEYLALSENLHEIEERLNELDGSFEVTS